jgi:starvation-inducible DNA-binding protein
MGKSNGNSASRTRKVAEAEQEISRSNTSGNELIETLQRQVANSTILYLNYKHYHWQTYGPLFRDLHLLFDEFATAVLATVDEFAERIRMIGGDPIANPTQMVEISTMRVAAAKGTMRQMVAEADTNEIVIIKEIRDGARLADDLNDPGTADLFARVVQIHEKHEWYLRDILEEGDGLTV